MKLAPPPLRLLLVGTVLVLVALLALAVQRSKDFMLVPDPAHPVAPLVEVAGGHDPSGRGGIYFVDVSEEHPSLLEKLIAPLRPAGSSLVPASAVIPSGGDYAASQRLARAMMLNSQRFAAAVALRSLGYSVVARPTGVQVDAVAPETDAEGKVLPGDLIVRTDGVSTITVQRLLATVRRHRIGDIVPVTLRRGDAMHTVRVRLTRAGPDVSYPAIGLAQVEQSAVVKLPVHVTIDAGNVGGPSAGLAFALDIVAELGHDVTRGYRVACTGQLNLDGTIGAIGGVKQKTFGARQAHADVFLVPVAGDNAREARRYAHGLKIIPVRNFQQALRALATLPLKR